MILTMMLSDPVILDTSHSLKQYLDIIIRNKD